MVRERCGWYGPKTWSHLLLPPRVCEQKSGKGRSEGSNQRVPVWVGGPHCLHRVLNVCFCKLCLNILIGCLG